MPANNTAADEAESDGGSPVFTEAEGLVNLLLDMHCEVCVCVETDELVIKPSQGCPTAAMSVFHHVRRKFEGDKAFRDDLTSYVRTLGDNLLVPAPAVLAWIKVRPFADVLGLVAQAGLLIRHHYEGGDGRKGMITFMPVLGQRVASNAHIIMHIVWERFDNEPEFARDVLAHAIAAGRSEHSA